jgi:hypothetical protein
MSLENLEADIGRGCFSISRSVRREFYLPFNVWLL